MRSSSRCSSQTLLPLGALAQPGVLVAQGGEVRHVLVGDDRLQHLGQGEVALAEVVGGVELRRRRRMSASSRRADRRAG